MSLGLAIALCVLLLGVVFWFETHPGVARERLERLAEWERNLWRPR